MIKWLLKRVLFLTIIAVIVFFAWQYGKSYFTIERQAPQETDTIQNQASNPLEALIIQQDGTEGKRFLRCVITCKTEPIPHAGEGEPLTDGQSWYYYTTLPETDKTALIRFWPDTNNTKVIAQETDLIKPRDVYINSTGTKVAYFLDNVSDLTKKLTEIWIYDTVSQSVSLAAENIYKPDLLTRLRWNATGTALWFVADSGVENESKIELIVIAAGTAPAKAAFASIDWQSLVDTADHGVMDISQSTNTLAYTKRSLGVFDRLIVVEESGQQYATTVTGSIAYLEWLPDSSLIYATQDALGFTFWRVQNNEAKIIVSQRGVLRSARSDISGQALAFVADSGQIKNRLFTFNLSSRLVKEQTKLPDFGNRVFVVAAKETTSLTTSPQSTITPLGDDQIAAFVDTNLASIVQSKTAQKIRLIMTNETNTIFIDYREKEQEPKRILLRVNDVINTEWSIRARYEPRNGQWQKVEGGGIADPKPVRIYEWEDSLKKWVLKQNLNS
jgi:hypothetical protein